MLGVQRTLAAAVALAATAAAGGGCARSASSLSREDLARVSASSPIAVVWTPSPEPYVDCPGDEGEKMWERGFSARARPGGVLTAAWGAGGGTWQQIVNAYTERLRRDPPVDPAAATAAAFVAASASQAGPLRFSGPAERADGGAPGAAAFVRFETTRSVLVGCFYDYSPWFNVRASLVDGATGRVVWRDACGGLYPGADAPPERPVEDLEWNGKALYRDALERRAHACAAELLQRLERGAGARG